MTNDLQHDRACLMHQEPRWQTGQSICIWKEACLFWFLTYHKPLLELLLVLDCVKWRLLAGAVLGYLRSSTGAQWRPTVNGVMSVYRSSDVLLKHSISNAVSL
jgi:hypothetical protein